jgi:VWFA-related protein
MVRIRTAVAVSLFAVALGSMRGDAQQPQQQPPPPGQTQPPQGDQPPAAQQPPIFRAGINFVRVDVIVTDKTGAAVTNLEATDFEITEEGKPQKIETFKLVQLDGGLMPGPDGPPRAIRTDYDEESEAARDDVRLFGVFLDDYHVRDGNSLAAREQIARFIETQLGPSDMVGLMYPLQPAAAVRFSRNHSVVQKGIQGFLGRKFDYTPRNEYEERYANYPTEIVERIRNQVSLSALQALISRMGGLKEGRKALVLVSEGYSHFLPPQMRDANSQMPGYGNPAAGNPMAGDGNLNEERAQWAAGLDMDSDLREVYAAANRNNVAIYPVDPRGLSPGEFGVETNIGGRSSRDFLNSTIDTLRLLASETDGRAIVNRNDLTIAMKQIVRDSSGYYLVGYSSTLAASDGKFHEIKVRVKRPGVQVRARRGYWALTSQEAARVLAPAKPAPPKAVETAIAAITLPSRARLIRTWIGTDRGENGKTRVTFVWEPVPAPPGAAARNAGQPARVALTAVGPDGAPYFRGRVPDAPATAPPAAGSSPARVIFEAQPGKIQLRLSVEGAGSEVLDAETREFTVPDLTSPQTALGTPEVFRARTVRDFQQLKGDPKAVPIAAREFSRTDRLLVRIPAWGPANSAPKLTARLLNRGGQAMSELPIAAASPGAPFEIDMPLAGLAPGEYVLEVSAAGEGGEAKELVGFRVS